MSFEIFTDTSANLTHELIERYNIHVIPFSYYIDGVEYYHDDPADFYGKAFYELMRDGVMPTTSQINPQRYIDNMEGALAEGRDVLYIGMSSGISGSFASSKLAAAQLMSEYPERTVRTLDTLAASMGEGLHVLLAARLREKGHTIDEVEAAVRAYRNRLYQVFTVDDLMHLKRSGRLSGIGAVIGTALGIKPLLKGNEHGKIVSLANVRGRRRSIKAMAEKYADLAVRPAGQTVAIAHADCPEDAEYLAQLLAEHTPPEEIITVCYEPVTGSHVGPGTLALFFEGGEGVRLK